MFSSLLPRPKHSAYLQPVLLDEGYSGNTETHSNDKNEAILNHELTKYKSSSTKNEIDVNKRIITMNQIGTHRNLSKYEDSIPLKKRYPQLKHHFPRYTLETCPDNTIEDCVAETKKVIDELLGVGSEKKTSQDASIIKYKSKDSDEDRIVQIRTLQEDPMLPPKFKLRKNRHREPSPPPPILKDTASATQKLTKEDRERWTIPAAVSNWKNNQGFALSLEDRIRAAHGGDSSSSDVLNVEKFSLLSNALESADKEARVEITMRNKMRQEQAAKEQKEKEAKLRELAERARNEKYRRPDHDNREKRTKRY